MEVEYKTFINGSCGGVEGLVVAPAAGYAPGVVGRAEALVGGVVEVAGRSQVGVVRVQAVAGEQDGPLRGSHDEELRNDDDSCIPLAVGAARISDGVGASGGPAGEGVGVPEEAAVAPTPEEAHHCPIRIGDAAASHALVDVVVPDPASRTLAVEVIEGGPGGGGEALAGDAAAVEEVNVDGGGESVELALLTAANPDIVGQADAAGVRSCGVLAGGVGVDIAESAVGFGAVGEGSLRTVALGSHRVPGVALHALAGCVAGGQTGGPHDS